MLESSRQPTARNAHQVRVKASRELKAGNALTRSSLLVLTLGAILGLGFLLYASDLGEPLTWLLLVPFSALVLLPYFLLSRAARRYEEAPAAAGLVLVGAFLSTGFGAFVFYSALVADEPDAQSGLVLFVVPVWQLLGVWLLLWLCRRVDRRREAV